jgi:2-polyprenyl-6-methoxyphenol hydroxylase-like FAD-dependent oxidoreductase/NAD dependent epimerase/dehydratase family enzyme
MRSNLFHSSRVFASVGNMRSIAVAGGGIGGMHFALAARMAGFDVTIFERDADPVRATIGSGLGLWPPALACANRVGILQRLQAHGAYMPGACYVDERGGVLGQPTAAFGKRFPVLCLPREALLGALRDRCHEIGVAVHSSRAVTGYTESEGRADALPNVSVATGDGNVRRFDFLVGADGIHSTVRKQMLANMERPIVESVSCGYVYYRATVNDATLHTAQSFESWAPGGLRFGYVPLQHPAVFWFVAVPMDALPAALKRSSAYRMTDSADADGLERLCSGWSLEGLPQPVSVKSLLRRSVEQEGILVTEVRKIPNVKTFPWSCGRVALLGDACHATAPNIAQGAGISIEDGAALAHGLQTAWHRDEWQRHGALEQALRDYERSRKRRAATVQLLADTVAHVGQAKAPLAMLRNVAMGTATRWLPNLVGRIFETVVSYSLGGGLRDLHWRPPTPLISNTITATRVAAVAMSFSATQFPEHSPLCRALGLLPFLALPEHVRRLRGSAAVLSGTGRVVVTNPAEQNSRLATTVRRLIGLPSETSSGAFIAGVVPESSVVSGRRVTTGGQSWTRIFGGESPYTTRMHAATCLDADCPSGIALLEGTGWSRALDSVLAIGYRVTYVPAGSTAAAGCINYDSIGIWVGPFRVRGLPSLLLPRSRWREVPTERGWCFEDGTISVPLVSALPLMHYEGDFVPNHHPPTANQPPATSRRRHVFITGGTGLLGTAVTSHLARRATHVDVTVLSRDPFTSVLEAVAGVQYHSLRGVVLPSSPSAKVVFVNLAGSNPGRKRWTARNGDPSILASRLEAIDSVHEMIRKRQHDDPSWRAARVVQASALVPSDRQVSAGSEFRTLVVDEIRSHARRRFSPDTVSGEVILLDIGILLSQKSGLYPYLRLAARGGVFRIGTGSQRVSWCTVGHAAATIAEVAMQDETDAGPEAARLVKVPIVEGVSTSRDLLSTIRKQTVSSVAVPVALCDYVRVPAALFRAAVGESASVVLDDTPGPGRANALPAQLAAACRRVEVEGGLHGF